MLERHTYGILLANTGTPAAPTKREIKRFLGRFLMDKRIAPFNRVFWWMLLHGHILPLRGRRNERRYATIWTEEGNPSTVTHEKLARSLNNAFEDEQDYDVVVCCGFNYSEPDTLEGLSYLKEQGCDRVVVLPLYPQSAYSTTGAVHDALERATAKMAWDVPCYLIDNYYDNSLYVRTVAASIKHAGFDASSNDRLLFSFHSIPLNDIENGDTYEKQTVVSCQAIAEDLGLESGQWTIGYQCRFDRGREWLKPNTLDILDVWARTEEGRVFVVCPGFAVDCLETLYDVNFEQKPHYMEIREAAGKNTDEGCFVYVPCLDRSKAHLAVLKDVVSPYIGEMFDGKSA